MSVHPRRARAVLLFAATSALALLGPAAAPAAADPGAVFTQTNGVAGNAIEAFSRAENGALTASGTFSTGGSGTGAGLGSQGAVTLSPDGKVLLAVNAGSSDVSSFAAKKDALRLVDRVASGGTTPVSVAVGDRVAYVLNAGATPNVSAFTLGKTGELAPIAGSTRALPLGASGPAQVSVTPDGRALIVTERLTNRIDTFALDAAGRPGVPTSIPANGPVPFGFAFGRGGTVVVSEAGNSTVSSYLFAAPGPPALVTASLPVGQAAACWVVTTPDGRYAYVLNAGGRSISGYAIADDGSLTALDADGRTADAPRPNDGAFSRDGRFLYAINPGAAAVSSYTAAADGSLEALEVLPATAGSAGIAAR